MRENEDKLLEELKLFAAGRGNEEEFEDMVFDDVYSLVFPIINEKKECGQITKEIIRELCSRVEELNFNKNIRRQMACFTTSYVFEYIRDDDTFGHNRTMLEYEYESIKEDVKLYEKIREYSKVFRDADNYRKADERFKKLSNIQMILIELFGYEKYSIENIEDILEIDSSFICDELARARAALLGIQLEQDEEELEGNSLTNEGEQRIEEADDVIIEYEDDIVPNGVTSMFFPSLPKNIRIAIGVGIVVVVIALIALILVFAKGSGSKNKKPVENGSVTTQTTTSSAQTTKPAAQTTKPAATTQSTLETTEPVNNSNNTSSVNNDVTTPEETTSTDEPANEPTDETVDETTEAPTDETTEAPTDESTEAPTDAPTEAPTDAPTDEPEANTPAAGE